MRSAETGGVRIDIPEGESADMTGAIRVAKAIMRNVAAVVIYSGGAFDSVWVVGEDQLDAARDADKDSL